jgi:hypothetical protein
MVDQELLIYKLLSYGFDNKAINILKNYFCLRKQHVKISTDASSDYTNISLGVPQGSVIGPLLFLIYINDIAYFLHNISTKLFADDTTLVFNSSSIDNTICSFKRGLLELNEWCKHNKLYINWDKTFAMFITNKNKIILPTQIEFENISIKVVNEFKLLGVVIDNKLKFDKFIGQQCANIYKRLYSIKRLFFLPHKVKVLFFKAFIMPYFDYCSSLSIYFNKMALYKLNKLYYICLFKLFRFNFLNWGLEKINNFLLENNLISFQFRIITNIMTFFAKIGSLNGSPLGLKEQMKITILSNNLRSNGSRIIIPERCINKYGENSFGYFASKLV